MTKPNASVTAPSAQATVVPASYDELAEETDDETPGQAERPDIERLPEPTDEVEATVETITPLAQPLALAAEAQPPPPTVEDVIRSVVEYFPIIQQATAGRGIAYGEVLEASGAFDHKFDITSDSQPLDFYENHRSSVGVKRETLWGGRTFAGYRIGRGVYEPWYLERETNKGGEFKAGFTAPLIRDRAIDANRSELWQAHVERTRIEAEIDMAVIASVRAGAIAYWEWVAAIAQLEVAEDVLQLGVARVAGLKKQVELGEKADIDEVDNQRIIVTRQAKVIDARRKVEQAASKLSLFLRDPAGRPIAPPRVSEAPSFFEPNAFDTPPIDQDVVFAASNRPEPRELRLVSQQLGIAIRQACNETWPDVDAGLLIAQDVGEPTSSKRDKSEFELEASLTLSVPLERRKAFGKLRQLRGKLSQVRVKTRFAEEKIAVDVQVARAALEAAAQRVEQTAEGVRLARQIANAEQDLFDAGQSTLFNLNIREKQAAEAAAELIVAQLDYAIAAADYAAALGLSLPDLDRTAEPINTPQP